MYTLESHSMSSIRTAAWYPSALRGAAALGLALHPDFAVHLLGGYRLLVLAQ